MENNYSYYFRGQLRTDWYAILGISSNSSFSAINVAFRRLVRDCQGSNNPDDSARLRAITEARNMLQDPVEKAILDEFHSTFHEQQRRSSRRSPPRSNGPSRRSARLQEQRQQHPQSSRRSSSSSLTQRNQRSRSHLVSNSHASSSSSSVNTSSSSNNSSPSSSSSSSPPPPPLSRPQRTRSFPSRYSPPRPRRGQQQRQSSHQSSSSSSLLSPAQASSSQLSPPTPHLTSPTPPSRLPPPPAPPLSSLPSALPAHAAADEIHPFLGPAQIGENTLLLDLPLDQLGYVLTRSNSITFIPQKYIKKTQRVYENVLNGILNNLNSELPVQLLHWKRLFLLPTILFSFNDKALLNERLNMLLENRWPFRLCHIKKRSTTLPAQQFIQPEQLDPDDLLPPLDVYKYKKVSEHIRAGQLSEAMSLLMREELFTPPTAETLQKLYEMS